jgi:class 3 adenylate cyclase
MEISPNLKQKHAQGVVEKAERAAERLKHIPHGRVMPHLTDMRFSEAKRFSMGVVFVDIHGSGNYLSENGPRETLFMLNVFIPQVMELVQDFDGYFEKNTGDGILAYFGVGKEDTEAVEDILEYLASVQYVLANYINPELRAYGVNPISVSAGAAYAEDVYISRIGIQNQSRSTAVSTAANASFELEERADGGEYFVNDGVYHNADRDSGWGQFLSLKGILDDFQWGSEREGYRAARYYTFTGSFENMAGGK